MTRDGVTLLEAVVAIAILSLAMVSAVGILAQSVDGRRQAEARVRAAFLAEQRLELVRALGPAELRRTIGEVTRGEFAPPFQAYRWAASIRSQDDVSGLVAIDVLVEWAGGRLPLSTLIARPPDWRSTP